jgi:hypothetical protein
MTISLESASPDLQIKLQEPKDRFLVKDVFADIRIRAQWDTLQEKPRGKEIFSSGSTWKLFDWEGSYLFRFTAPFYGTIPYKEAIFNPDFSTGEIRLHRPFYPPEQPLDPLGYPLDELLITNYLSRGKGVEVHACGMVDSQGRGHLFLGQSGAGKSTIARLWQDQPGITVLSDDRIILRQKEESIWMFGTPWHGDAGLASPGYAELKRVYFLAKGPQNQLMPLKKAEALGGLFACSFPPFYSSEAIDFILDFFEELVNTLPCYELSFRPDQRVVEFMKRLDEKD